MIEKLKEFENRKPEIVFEWKDALTDAEGFLVINSLRGGAAGGGTRMRKGLDKQEVVSLAKTMEIKFAVCGPEIGGGKSGINFDPNDPRKNDVLKRWYKAVMPILKTYYGTGGDLNVDEIHDVIPITSSFGLLHPQEGVVNGHYQGKETEKRISNLQNGVVKAIIENDLSPSVERKYTVADMITGYGVFESVRHFYNLTNIDLKGQRVLIQGWGNVASAAAYYFAQEGAIVAGIIDRDGGLYSENGFSFEEIKQLFLDKDGNKLRASNVTPFEELNQSIWNNKFDIFVPAAASRIVTRAQLNSLIENGLSVISSGANVPFADLEIFYGPIAEWADKKISVIPDFIANCGMARTFAYLMSENPVADSKHIFEDVSNTMHVALKEALEHNKNNTTELTSAAYDLVLRKVM